MNNTMFRNCDMCGASTDHIDKYVGYWLSETDKIFGLRELCSVKCVYKWKKWSQQMNISYKILQPSLN